MKTTWVMKQFPLFQVLAAMAILVGCLAASGCDSFDNGFGDDPSDVQPIEPDTPDVQPDAPHDDEGDRPAPNPFHDDQGDRPGPGSNGDGGRGRGEPGAGRGQRGGEAEGRGLDIGAPAPERRAPDARTSQPAVPPATSSAPPLVETPFVQQPQEPPRADIPRQMMAARSMAFQLARVPEHFSGAVVFCSKGCEPGRKLKHDLREHPNWKSGYDNNTHFKFVDVGPDSGLVCPTVAYYEDGVETGRVEGYGGHSDELNAILRKHSACVDEPPAATLPPPQVIFSEPVYSAPICTSRICVGGHCY